MAGSLNATERVIKENGKEVLQIMPAYVSNNKVCRLPEPRKGVTIYVERPVYEAAKGRSDLRLVKK